MSVKAALTRWSAIQGSVLSLSMMTNSKLADNILTITVFITYGIIGLFYSRFPLGIFGIVAGLIIGLFEAIELSLFPPFIKLPRWPPLLKSFFYFFIIIPSFFTAPLITPAFISLSNAILHAIIAINDSGPQSKKNK